MLKIIHSRFELDLSNYDISIIEENSWFSDNFFTKFTLPFSFIITDELNSALGDPLSHNSEDSETYFDVYFYHNGEENEAVFEIDDIQGREASGTIRFGQEEISNYNKKLSELPLDDFAIQNPETIYTHAENIITKTWPEVTHNFVMVHTDKFDTETDQWQFFEGVLNKREAGNFVENSYDDVNDFQVNKNVMMPQPYKLHVLQKAVEDAGYVLGGDILEDPELKKALFSEISDYYTQVNIDAQDFKMHSGEHHTLVNTSFGSYLKTINLTEPGRYKIAGNLFMKNILVRTYVLLRYDGKEIFHSVKKETKSGFLGLGSEVRYRDYTFPININVDVSPDGPSVLEFTSHQYIFKELDGEFIEDEPIMDLTITQLSKLDANGQLQPTLVVPEEIKLNKCVPDITVGEFIKTLRLWKNFDIVPQGNVLSFNYIENQLNTNVDVDLSDFEVKNPLRQPNSGISFVLKFQKVNSEEYTFESVVVDKDGFSTSRVPEDDANEIIVNAIPLPIISKGNITTAHHFIDDKSKIKTLLYAGAPGKENLAEDPAALLMPEIYNQHYQNWLSFRISGQLYTWDFKMTEEQLKSLGLKSKVYAYKNNFIIKSINKDLVYPGLWLVELEASVLKPVIQ